MIEDNVHKAEVKIDKWHDAVDEAKRTEDTRRQKEKEKRTRELKTRAVELKEEIQDKIKYCHDKGYDLLKNINQKLTEINDIYKSGKYKVVIAELEKLISEFDNYIYGQEMAKEINNSIGMKFVKIPDKNFYMGKYPITQKEWKAVMGTTPWIGKTYAKEGDDYPATYISWDDCQEFVKKLNQREGIDKYRLPAEEEWKYACSTGNKSKYCFGDDVTKLAEYGWYGNIGNEQYGDNPKEVGKKKPNKWGLFDMHGNVDEWCLDWFDKDKDRRVRRGGGWHSPAKNCTVSYRGMGKPNYRSRYLGFRPVRSA